MSTDLPDNLMQRRARLVARSGQLRQDWSQQVGALHSPLGLVDRARSAGHWLARNPEWPLGALVLLVLLRPTRVLRWSGYAWQGWALYRRAQRVFGPQRPPAV